MTLGPTPSWVDGANDPGCDVPVDNLPCGVVVLASQRRCCTVIGDRLLDLHGLEAAGVIDFGGTLRTGAWNAHMAAGRAEWARLRATLSDLLSSAPRDDVAAHLLPRAGAALALPFAVAEFTDFYASRHHAMNVGTMFRGPENALPPNWDHMPIGYNGRASSVVVSGTPVRRPWGQLKGPDDAAPRLEPSERFDFELEVGAVVGWASDGPLTVAEAHDAIFGYVLLNDWSARDIQAWEYQPLGPFQGKATATTVGPWIVTAAALEPFRVPTQPPAVPLLPHLAEPFPTLYDVALSVDLTPESRAPTTIARTNLREMSWSAAQQLAHHTSSGCPMRVGDLLGSGTVSGPDRDARGALLELSWNGAEPMTVEGGTRTFLQDGDTVTLRGAAERDGLRIGFGACAGRVLPALPPRT